MNETSIINSIKHLPAVAVGLLLMAACTTENEEAEIRPMPLTFSLADVQTRGEALTTDNVTSVGVFAFFSQGEFNANTATPSFMYNQKVERTDNTSPWTYSPIKYWPNNVKDKISFFAYAPHSNEITDSELTMSGNTDKGYPWLTFTNKTAQTDFLLSEPLINKDNTETCISFKLKHALAKVSFYVKNGDTTPGKKIHSFTVHSRQSGKYTFNETGFVYSAATTIMREDAITTVPVDIPENITDKVLLETLFIHPDKETNFSLTYSINGNDANKIEIVSQKVPATPDLVSGANINYTITINNDGYTITASNEKEWAQGSENKITYYAADDLKIGDYYYSDGTWSDGGLTSVDKETKTRIWISPLPDPNLINPKTSVTRQCIGVIFATEEDAVITDKASIKAMVVSPKDEKRSQCIPSLTNTTTDFAPPTGSDWLHPDEKILRWIAKGDGTTATYLREILDDHLIKITNGEKLAGEYWVSPFTVNNVTRTVMNLSSGSYYDANYLQGNVGFRGILYIYK